MKDDTHLLGFFCPWPRQLRLLLLTGIILFLFLSPWPKDFPTSIERIHIVTVFVWLVGWPPVTKKRLLLLPIGLTPLLFFGVVRLFFWKTVIGSQFRAFPQRELLVAYLYLLCGFVNVGFLAWIISQCRIRLLGEEKRRWLSTASVGLTILLALGYGACFGAILKLKTTMNSTCPYPHEEVSFPASDGVLLRGWYIPSNHEDPPGHAIVFHPAACHRGSSLRFARYFYERGFDLLLFDHRGHGESQGHLSTMGPMEVRDVEGAIAFLKTRGEVSEGSIFVSGESMGAIMSVISGGLFPEIGPVAAHASYADLPSAGRDLVGRFLGPLSIPAVGLGWRGAQALTRSDFRQHSPIAQVADIGSDGLFLSHGTDDYLIPFHHGTRLFELAVEPKEFYAIQDLIHVQSPFRDPEYEKAFVAFIDEATERMRRRDD